MTLTLGDIEFDNVDYDAEGDVLYLHVGDPSRAEQFDETPEGHHLRFDRGGQLVGLTILRPKHLLQTRGELAITMTKQVSAPERVDAAGIAALLG